MRVNLIIRVVDANDPSSFVEVEFKSAVLAKVANEKDAAGAVARLYIESLTVDV